MPIEVGGGGGGGVSYYVQSAPLPNHPTRHHTDYTMHLRELPVHAWLAVISTGLGCRTRPMLLTLFLRSGHSVTMTLLDNPRVIQEKHVVVNNRCTGNQPSLCYTCIPAVQGRVACNKHQLQCSAQYSFCISDYKLNEIFCSRQKSHY